MVCPIRRTSKYTSIINEIIDEINGGQLKTMGAVRRTVNEVCNTLAR